MATPTTLVELEQQRVATWTAEKAAAQTALQSSQSQLTTALAALKVATDEHTHQTNEIASLRVKLAAITTPADATPLLAALNEAIQAQRAAVDAMLTAESDVTNTRAAGDAERSRVQVADKALVAAQADLVAVTAEQTKRDAAKAAITQAPLSTLAADATALLASATFTAAKTRIETDFPQALRDRARERVAFVEAHADRATTSQTAVQALIDSYYISKGSVADKVAALQRSLADAEDALFEYVSRASSRYDSAEATLERLGDADYEPLTTEEHKAIDNAALLTDRESAATAQSERDIAQDALEQAQAKYDLEYLKVYAVSGAAGVTAELTNAASALAQAKSDLDDATAELTAKQTAFDSNEQSLLDEWEAAVPDTSWRDLLDFDSAEATLNELKTGAAALVTAVNNAENALLTALLAVDVESQQLQAYETVMAESANEAYVAESLLARARFGALRGDY